MKQNIDYKDFESLSEVAQKKARELWTPRIGDKAFLYPDNSMIGDIPHVGFINDIDNGVWISINKEDDSGEWGDSAEYVRPLFSIGQMIEILDEKETWPSVTPAVDDGIGYWIVYNSSGRYTSDDLCDALWEAVKPLLEDK